MIKVNVIVNNKNWKKNIINPEKYLKKKTQSLNSKYAFFKKKKVEFSLLLSGKTEIKKLNKDFRKKNKATDVLSFPFYEKKELKKIFKKNKTIYLGDIIVNLNMVNKKNDTKKNFYLNFDKLWIHGLIHLLGGRHLKNKDYLAMQKLERKYLSLVS